MSLNGSRSRPAGLRWYFAGTPAANNRHTLSRANPVRRLISRAEQPVPTPVHSPHQRPLLHPSPTLRARRSATIGRESKARRTVRPSATGGPVLDRADSERPERLTLCHTAARRCMNQPVARPALRRHAPSPTRARINSRCGKKAVRFSAKTSRAWFYGGWHRELKVHSRRLLLY